MAVTWREDGRDRPLSLLASADPLAKWGTYRLGVRWEVKPSGGRRVSARGKRRKTMRRQEVSCEHPSFAS